MKMISPDHQFASISAESGGSYEADENGHFAITHPADIAAARMLGLVEVDPLAGVPIIPTAERIPSEFDATIEALKVEAANAADTAAEVLKQSHDENDKLRNDLNATSEAVMAKDAELVEKNSAIADLEKRLADALAAAAASSASIDSSGSGGTSETQEGPTEPVWDDMDRDQLVEWINGNGGVIAKNVSHAVALSAAQNRFKAIDGKAE